MDCFTKRELRMSSLSICTICQDEAEVLPEFLESCKFIADSLKEDFKELVIVDGGSKDTSVEIIKSYQDKMPIVLIEYPFDTFGQQKNRALERATGDFILGIDADMTITTNFPQLFKTGYFQAACMWDFMLYFTARDKYHHFKWPPGYTMRLWKRGPLFITNFHEKLQGQYPGVPSCPEVTIFENSFRQSEEALLNRGRRYQRFQKEMSEAGGGPGDELRYLNASKAPDSEIAEIPAHVCKYIL